jgi:hypothetical protein
MDKYGISSDNNKKLSPMEMEKEITPSINSMLSSIQFGHARTPADRNT